MSHSVLEGLASADPAERRSACRAAADDPSAVLLLEALAGALGDPDNSVARAASDALVAIGRRAPDAERTARRALRGDDPRRRWNAAFTLARLAPPEPGLVPALVEAMASPDGDVRWAAAKLLVETGRLHPEILRVAIGLARGAESAVVRRMAAFCLRELAPDDPFAASALLEATRDGDVHARRAAVTALAALLAPPPAVSDRLLELLRADSDPIVRRLAAVALGELAARERGAVETAARGALTRARGETADPDLRRAAERALARMGAEA